MSISSSTSSDGHIDTPTNGDAVNSSNVDHNELNKFGDLASRWWDPNSEFKPLHDINPLRLGFIEQQVGVKDKRIVDVGCGGGILSESMAAKGADVTGLDLAEPAITVAKLHALESGQRVDYRLESAEDHAENNFEQYDVVTCLEMLEHVPSPEVTVAACARLVKPGGSVFFSTLNRNPKSWLFAIIGAEHVLKLLPVGTHDYHRFIKPSELSRWCRDAALDVVAMRGMTYNPLTKVYRLGDDVSVNYLIEARKPDLVN